MNVIEEIKRINDIELSKGIANTNASWHCKYANSAWVYIGNIPNELSEGDVICVFSQFGEVEDFNLVRDETTGKSRGFAFLKYEDARCCILAVDNLTGSKVLGRSLRVDHVENYRLPKHLQEKRKIAEEDGEEKTFGPGHAYYGQDLATSFDISTGQDLFAPHKNIKENLNESQKVEAATKETCKAEYKAEKRSAKEKRQAERKSHSRKSHHRPREEEIGKIRKKRRKSEEN